MQNFQYKTEKVLEMKSCCKKWKNGLKKKISNPGQPKTLDIFRSRYVENYEKSNHESNA